MNEGIFAQVKQSVTARAAAEFYGIRTNRRGMARCPFHDDHTPSMILDQNYYCFGCQAKGDVVDFTAKLFGIRPLEAAKKLITDMCLPIPKGRTKHVSTQTGSDARNGGNIQNEKTGSGNPAAADLESARNRRTEKQFHELAEHYFLILIRYRNRLLEQKNRYAPKKPEEEWDPRFAEILSSLTRTEYLLDLLLFDGTDDKIGMMKSTKDEVMRIEEDERNIYKRTGNGDSVPA